MNWWEWLVTGWTAGALTVVGGTVTVGLYVKRHPQKAMSYFMSKALNNSR